MAPLSIVGTVFTIASIGIVCYYVFQEPLNFEGKHAVGSLGGFPLFFGNVLFALEAIAVVSINTLSLTLTEVKIIYLKRLYLWKTK